MQKHVLDLVEQLFNITTHEKGELIVLRGHPCDRLYIVKSGTVTIEVSFPALHCMPSLTVMDQRRERVNE